MKAVFSCAVGKANFRFRSQFQITAGGLESPRADFGRQMFVSM